MKVKLKAIRFGVDFRKTEMTNYEMFRKTTCYPGDLGNNEVFLMVSRSGNQLLWILNVEEIKAIKSTRKLIDTRRWRIDGSNWNPMMLANYAEKVGLELVGIKKFTEQYIEYRLAKRKMIGSLA